MTTKKEKIYPYAELRQAYRDGKRVVFQQSNGKWTDIRDELDVLSVFHISRYKIVANDECYTTVYRSKFGPIKIKVTKSVIDGKVTLEAIE
jgi:hypothetical protein